MAFVGRTLDEIRDQLLNEWAYQYTLAGEVLLIIEGSDAWRTASSIALSLMAQEHEAEVLQDQILPDKAATAFLNRHGTVDGIAREPATAAVLRIAVYGVPGASSAPTGRALVSSAALRFTVVSSVIPLEGTLDGSGDGTLLVRCATPGTDGNLAVGDTLTWVTAPPSFLASATVLDVETAGEAEQSDGDYAANILAQRQERPGSSNRQDWRTWVLPVDGVDEVYVYERVQGGTPPHPQTTGAVLVLALGPLPGTSADYTRAVSGTTLTRIYGYIEGTSDASGNAVVDGAQLRPVTTPPGSYFVETPTIDETDLDVQVQLSAANAFSYLDFGGHYSVVASPAPTTTTFRVAPAPNTRPAAEQLASGDAIAIAGPTRGGFFLTTASAVNAATGDVVCDPPLDVAPAVGATLRPSTPVWASILAAECALFDALGPQDTDIFPASPLAAARWPSPETSGRPKLYVSQIQAAALSVAGVQNATVAAPIADVTPNALHLPMLRTFSLTPL